jgi:hypothetical protein
MNIFLSPLCAAATLLCTLRQRVICRCCVLEEYSYPTYLMIVQRSFRLEIIVQIYLNQNR